MRKTLQRSQITPRKRLFIPCEAVFHSNVHSDVFHTLYQRIGHVTLGRWSHAKVSSGRLPRRFSLMLDAPGSLVFYDSLMQPSGFQFSPSMPRYSVLIPRVLTKRKV